MTLSPYSRPSPSKPHRKAFHAKRVLGEREIFLIFVKVLFKCIEQTDNGRLRQHAKAVVSECAKRNCNGDSKHLKDVVEGHLKRIVGGAHWDQAIVYTRYYCQRKGLTSSVSHRRSHNNGRKLSS